MAACAMDQLVPSWASPVTVEYLNDNCDAEIISSAAAVMLRKSLQLIALTRDDYAVGRDWMRFPTLRVFSWASES